MVVECSGGWMQSVRVVGCRKRSYVKLFPMLDRVEVGSRVPGVLVGLGVDFTSLYVLNIHLTFPRPEYISTIPPDAPRGQRWL